MGCCITSKDMYDFFYDKIMYYPKYSSKIYPNFEGGL